MDWLDIILILTFAGALFFFAPAFAVGVVAWAIAVFLEFIKDEKS